MDSSCAEWSVNDDRSLIEVERVITDINAGYKQLRSICQHSDETIWTCGSYENTLELYNLHGKLMKSLPTKLKTSPLDIAVTESGDLVNDYDQICGHRKI